MLLNYAFTLTFLITLCSTLFIQEKTLDKHSEFSSLVLLHVLFRHGNRTAETATELYPKDPYLKKTYFPFGHGQLTNAGKRREYSIGKTLRERYDSFLGPYYYPEIVDPVSTNYNRTKMSLELVLASLFPPRGEGIWKDSFNWQPAPYNYLPRDKDPVLLGVNCPNYLKMYDQVSKSPKLQQEFNKYQEVFYYISENTGLNVTRFLDVYNLFFGIATEEEWGLNLPEWTKRVWPKKITELAIKEYFVSTKTTDMVRMASGYFIKKLIEDTHKKINGKNDDPYERKMYMYSAHENNIAELLISLDIFDKPHIPTYGSYLIIEVHNINHVYGIKIFYENYSSNTIQQLKLPACDAFCPLEKFITLVEEYIPSDDLCGN